MSEAFTKPAENQFTATVTVTEISDFNGKIKVTFNIVASKEAMTGTYVNDIPDI